MDICEATRMDGCKCIKKATHIVENDKCEVIPVCNTHYNCFSHLHKEPRKKN